MLRNAPTFVEDNEKNGEAPTTEGEDPAAGQGTTAPKPGIAEKIMTKLGLNPIILMSMFKSVLPISDTYFSTHYFIKYAC